MGCRQLTFPSRHQAYPVVVKRWLITRRQRFHVFAALMNGDVYARTKDNLLRDISRIGITRLFLDTHHL